MASEFGENEYQVEIHSGTWSLRMTGTESSVGVYNDTISTMSLFSSVH